jgi:hypothetical protein
MRNDYVHFTRPPLWPSAEAWSGAMIYTRPPTDEEQEEINEWACEQIRQRNAE